jgi:hypothetical protein
MKANSNAKLAAQSYHYEAAVAAIPQKGLFRSWFEILPEAISSISRDVAGNVSTYRLLAFAFRTAAKNRNTVMGMLIAKIIAVFMLPRSGSPEASSNIEPTAAIAATHEPPRNKPLIGVIIFFVALLGNGFDCTSREAMLN